MNMFRMNWNNHHTCRKNGMQKAIINWGRYFRWRISLQGRCAVFDVSTALRISLSSSCTSWVPLIFCSTQRASSRCCLCMRLLGESGIQTEPMVMINAGTNANHKARCFQFRNLLEKPRLPPLLMLFETLLSIYLEVLVLPFLTSIMVQPITKRDHKINSFWKSISWMEILITWYQISKWTSSIKTIICIVIVQGMIIRI